MQKYEKSAMILLKLAHLLIFLLLYLIAIKVNIYIGTFLIFLMVSIMIDRFVYLGYVRMQLEKENIILSTKLEEINYEK